MRSLYTSSLISALCILAPALCSQEHQFHGQATGWFSSAEKNVQLGARYLPELSAGYPVGNDFNSEFILSLNCFSTSQFFPDRSPLYSGTVQPYRLWGRISSDRFEVRLGLQKINFGSATLLRPLMWFDAINPHDPLQLTDGVYALLARYFFPDNSNVWLWSLYGNNDIKGVDIAPSKKQSIEFGGRAQIPFWNGEIAATYHHRTADLNSIHLSNISSPEDRYALDGKWDIGIGAWFESVLIHRSSAGGGLRYQRIWMLGTDYTFDAGNGLTVLTEYFRTDNPDKLFAPAKGVSFSAFSFSYPFSIMDRGSCMIYRDWTNNEWYRLVSFQRTYDNWIFHLIGFWNPSNARRAQIVSGQTGSRTYQGKGVQIMAVFNH